MSFLPVNRQEMEAIGWDRPDFLYVTGDAYVDHPSFGTAIISRVLEREGFRVAILSQPENKGKIVVFGGIKNCRFKVQVVPGDVLELSCELTAVRGPVGFGNAVATVNGKVAAQGEISFAITG